MLSVARPVTPSTPVLPRRLTVAAAKLRVAVVVALCSGRSARSVHIEFRYAALSLGSAVAIWLDDTIHAMTGESVRG